MTYEVFHNTTIGELLSVQATRFPNQTFLRLDDKRWSYADVELQACSLAAGLRDLGLQPGDRLAVTLPNTPEHVVTIFAAAKAGLILVPINVRRDQSDVLARFAKTKPRALVTFSGAKEAAGVDQLEVAEEMRKQIPELEFVVSVSHAKSDKKRGILAWESLLKDTAALPPAITKPRDAAAIIHSLGSAGEPRGATLTHGGMARNAAAMAERMDCSAQDVFLGTVPFSNTFGITAILLACAVAGAQLVCMPHFHPSEALRLIRETGVTILSGVPTMFALELNHKGFDSSACATLRAGIMAGAPCPSELVRRARAEMDFKLLIGYGLTEASPAVTMTQLDDGPITATETVGIPLDGVEIKVIGADGETLANGEEGELCARGYNIMTGYWGDPQATAQVLDKDGWLRTGDLAVIDADGPARIVGRKDEVIMRGGFKIHPGAVEMILRSCPGVRDAAVVGAPDLIYGELTCACIVVENHATLSKQDVLDFAAAHLPDYARPDRVLFFDALPRNAGVVHKEYLRERVRIHGHAWRFGKNIDTDAIIPARRCNTSDPRELALYCMEDADADFVKKMKRGDLIVADSNFGCGSSREVAPLAIKAAGVSAVVAASFARIFFRNAINIGLPILECPQAVEGINEGDEIEVEPAAGIIRNLTTGEQYQAAPFPEFLRRIIDVGGLLAYAEERLAQQINITTDERG
ncbi:MAG: AMP-binding protein [Anaerolineales bacterium]|nr:MAG: AMP-binding protein [Anaerolineales bacterium]